MNTNCSPVASQTNVDLRLNCTISGQIPNFIVNPGSSTDFSCRIDSFLVFNQSVSSPATAIFGENGEDDAVHVRLGLLLPGGTHSGSIAKANQDCTATVGPVVPINTTFGGRYRALVDKRPTPMCVFRSRLDFTAFTQTIGTGLPLDISAATSARVRDILERRLDLESANIVGGMLQRSANRAEQGHVARSGRCLGDYNRFVGT